MRSVAGRGLRAVGLERANKAKGGTAIPSTLPWAFASDPEMVEAFKVFSAPGKKKAPYALRALVVERTAASTAFEAMAHGKSFTQAIVDYCRDAGSKSKGLPKARAVAQSLYDDPELHIVGVAALAAIVHDRVTDLSIELLDELGDDRALTYLPVEYVEASLESGRRTPDVVAAQVSQLATIRPEDRARVLEAFFAVGARDKVVELAEAWEGLAGTDDERYENVVSWARRALEPKDAPAVPDGVISFGVMGYDNVPLNSRSTNIGDYVQTAAALSHLVRHEDITFTGPHDLVDAVERLQSKVQPKFRLSGQPRTINLVEVNRDASSFDTLPEDTWMIAFGWHMQPQFRGVHEFPYNPRIKPIFVSFHVNRRDLLTPDAIEYLREHGPIGCRDWNTVDVLTNMGVPAFFSGCLTTTIDAYFDVDGYRPPSAGTAFVDSPVEGAGTYITQAYPEVTTRSVARNLDDAIALLTRYRDEFRHIVTTRLHCYLPASSIGVDVKFAPKNRSDVRFEGIINATPADLVTMRTGIRDVLEPAITALLAGASDDEVRAAWKASTEPIVAAHEALRADYPRELPSSIDFDAAVAGINAGRVRIEGTEARTKGKPVNVAFALDGNLKRQLRVVVSAMVEHSTRPLHLWILSRDHSPEDFESFAAAFPEVITTWLPTDDVSYGDVTRMLPHITLATMDRLLLPNILSELDHVVYHDIDALPFGDVAELHDTPLGDAPLAARTSPANLTSSGFHTIYAAAKALKDREDRGQELLHRTLREHKIDFPAFNAGVLVMNLDAMRRDDFVRLYVPYVERYGLNDQEVLNFYAGARRLVLDPKWNSVPTQDAVAKPGIVHWAGGAKPWQDLYVRYQHTWEHYEAVAAERSAR